MDELDPSSFPEFSLNLPTVHIETDTFSAEVIEMYELPHEQVLDMLTAQGPRQIIRMMDAFRLAVLNPKDVDSLDTLSFNEMTEAVGQWAAKSQMRWLEVATDTIRQNDKHPPIDPPLNDDDRGSNSNYEWDEDPDWGE